MFKRTVLSGRGVAGKTKDFELLFTDHIPQSLTCRQSDVNRVDSNGS